MIWEREARKRVVVSRPTICSCWRTGSDGRASDAVRQRCARCTGDTVAWWRSKASLHACWCWSSSLRRERDPREDDCERFTAEVPSEVDLRTANNVVWAGRRTASGSSRRGGGGGCLRPSLIRSENRASTIEKLNLELKCDHKDSGEHAPRRAALLTLEPAAQAVEVEDVATRELLGRVVRS